MMMPTPLAVDVQHKKRVEGLKERGVTDMYSRQNGDSRPNGLMDYISFTGLLKTPSAMDVASENMKSRGVSGTSGTLAQEMQSGYVAKRGFILPTPNAQDWNTEWTPEQKQACLDRRAAEGKTAYPSKFNALKQMAYEGLLPTPTAIEGTKFTNTYNPDSQMGQSLSAMAGSGMLPTPRANKVDADLNNPNIAARNKANLEEAVAKMITENSCSDSSQKTDGGAFRLSPLFTEEMMGFPFLWTALPFLNLSGEQKVSKPTGTR